METEDAWDAHLEGMRESYEPQGRLEEELVDRQAVFWRLHRLKDYETAQLNYRVHTTEQHPAIAEAYAPGTLSKGELPEIDPREVAVYQHLHTVPAGSTLDNVIRYETHLHRQWVQTHHELEALQARRRGERAPLARLDFSAPPQS